MPLLSNEYIAVSLLIHFGLFIVVYGAYQTVFYVIIPEWAAPLKLTKGKYPSKELQRKELFRSSRSVLIAFLMDLLVLFLYDLDFAMFRENLVLTSNQRDLMAQDRYVGWTEQLSANGYQNLLYPGLFYVVGLVLWSDFHFYWTHRLLHENEWLYKNVHKIHHESYNPDTIAGLSFHPIESLIYFSSMLSFLLYPVPLWVYHLHRFMLVISPANGHTSHVVKGAEYVPGGDRPWYYIADPVDHWIHHTKFNYNFSSGILPRNGIWDNLCGTAYKPRVKDGPLSDREKASLAQRDLVADFSKKDT